MRDQPPTDAHAPTSRSEVFRGRLFHVEQRVITVAGRDAAVRRDVVVHPGAAVILPVLSDDRIVLIRNYRYSVERAVLELPAGTLEPGEAPIDNARRELQEETGYRAGRVEPFCEFFPSPGILTERMYAFLATDLTEGQPRPEETELIAVEVLPLAQVRQLFLDGRFEDGKTIAVLGLYLARRGVH